MEMENKEKEIDIIALMHTVWGRRRLLIKWGCVGLVAGVIIAFSIPKQYVTIVKIAPEGTPDSKVSSMSGLAAMAGMTLPGTAEEGISEKLYPEIVKSTPFLLEFADMQVDDGGVKMSLYEYLTEHQRKAWWSYVIGAPMQAVGWIVGLFSDEDEDGDGDGDGGKRSRSRNSKSKSIEDIDIFKPTTTQIKYINVLGSLVSIEPDKKTGILKVTTKMQDPLISATLADSLISKLQLYMTDYRTGKARADLRVNEKKLEEARQSYYAAEDAYAEAQDKNRNLTTQFAQVKIDRLSNEKMLAFGIYQQIATEVELGKVKLQEQTPIATVVEPASVPLRADSPKKLFLMVIFTFLGVFGAAMAVVVREVVKNTNDTI